MLLSHLILTNIPCDKIPPHFTDAKAPVPGGSVTTLMSHGKVTTHGGVGT